MSWFKSKYTKWIPLGEFQFGDAQSVVLARGNKKTGELFFKTKRINRHALGYCHPIGRLPLNVSDQWNLLQTLTNE